MTETATETVTAGGVGTTAYPSCQMMVGTWSPTPKGELHLILHDWRTLSIGWVSCVLSPLFRCSRVHKYTEIRKFCLAKHISIVWIVLILWGGIELNTIFMSLIHKDIQRLLGFILLLYPVRHGWQQGSHTARHWLLQLGPGQLRRRPQGPWWREAARK